MAVALLVVAPAAAQEFGIKDNSFLVEEAFNQEAGIFQNIATYRWQRGQWVGSFTQEWPVPNMTHQLSFTVGFGRVAENASIGDVLVNYRLQVWEEASGRPAVAPRASVILPVARDSSGLGNGVVGWQFNAPFSKQHGDWYFHWNGGLTYFPPNRDRFQDAARSLLIPTLAGSVIWQASPVLNFLVEVVGESVAEWSDTGDVERFSQITVSPGFRYAWNPGKQQVVVGLAAPIARGERVVRTSVFTYFSYELPFK